jgi:hypothetical protein
MVHILRFSSAEQPSTDLDLTGIECGGYFFGLLWSFYERVWISTCDFRV